MKKYFFVCLLIANISTETLYAQEKDSVQQYLSLGIETLSVLNNYKSIPFFINYNYNRRINFELGFGPVIDSESYNLEEENVQENGGGIVYGEIDYFFLKKRNGPFVGVGYSYLISNFESTYVLRLQQGIDRYFQNMTDEVRTTISNYYIPIGFRFYALEDRLYFEPSIRIQYVDKNVTHSNLIIEGAVSNHELQEIDDYYVVFFDMDDPYDTPEEDNGPVSIMYSCKIGFTFYSFKK
ncbi:MAG: hypothetical protein OCD76_01095 [Reichenbachiella sp.]